MLEKLVRSVSSAALLFTQLRAGIPLRSNDELERLTALCAHLIHTLSARQYSFSREIRHYCASPSESSWQRLEQNVADLATEVTRIFRLLKRERGEFTIEDQETYRSLVLSLAERTEIFEEIRGMTYPPSSKDVDRLNSIADHYDDLRAALFGIQKEIADYVKQRRKSESRADAPLLNDAAHMEIAQPSRSLKGERENYDLFISHASEDKAIARPLYDALTAKGVSVWYDEAVLKLGDSLRRNIDKGLAKCRYGVVIISPDFLSKEWPQRELDGFLARETVMGKKAILPIWHNLSSADIALASPTLSDRLAVRSDEGIGVILEQILDVLQE